MRLRVLTWNLFHGRSKPGAGCSLEREFTELIASWQWDVALLQEVPPWWPRHLAAATGTYYATHLTSRNSLLPLRRFIAERWPDVIKSNGGGAHAILSREPILAHGRRRLRWLPERRYMHAVKLASGVWVANLHASKQPHERPVADIDLARTTVLRWAGDAAIVIGGDLNIRDPVLPGFVHVAAHHVDHVFARGLQSAGEATTPRRGRLSDHAPVLVELEG